MPKMFFIRACYGEGTPEVPLKDKNAMLMDDDQPGDEEACELLLDSDFFFSSALYQTQLVSLRHIAKGSVYIRELCTILRNHSREDSLEEMIAWLHFQLTNIKTHPLLDRQERGWKATWKLDILYTLDRLYTCSLWATIYFMWHHSSISAMDAHIATQNAFFQNKV